MQINTFVKHNLFNNQQGNVMNKKTVMKSFRFYPSLAQSVSCEARHRDISEAEFVRKIIEESLKNDRK